MQLVSFNPDTLTTVNENTKTGTRSVSLLSARDFRESNGLKGQEAKKAYNDYLRTNGRANTAALAGAMTSGELLVKGFQDSKNGLRVSFIKAKSIKDSKKEEKQMDPALVMLADLTKGMTPEQLEALAASIKAGAK